MELRSQKNRMTQSANHKARGLVRLNWMLFIIQLIVMGYLGFLAFRHGILQMRLWTYVIISIVLIIVLMQLTLNLLKKAKIFNFIFTFLAIVAMAFGSLKITEFVGLFSQLNEAQGVTEYTMSIVVLKESEITDVKQLNGQNVQAPLSFDQENIDELLKNLEKEKNVKVNAENVDSYHAAYLNLIAGESKAIVLSSSFESVLAAQYPELSEKIRKVYEYKKRQVVSARPTTNQKTDIFHVYLSGVDAFGDIGEVSRSDVNIIATVNTKTRQVLLTSTPRDAYVRIADAGRNQFDKLTHAGIYGIDTSIHTLENLYGIKIDYFMRINFSTFMELIDVIGGIEIDNEYGFQSYADPNLYFEAGRQTLDSYDALFYVRERYNLHDGDVGRARHQTQVIKAILSKMMSPVLLTNSSQIISQVGKSAQMNITFETLMVLINQYLDDTSKGYTVESQALAVEGRTGLRSYALPSADLWMGVVQQDSLKEVTENIQKVMKGEQPTITNRASDSPTREQE